MFFLFRAVARILGLAGAAAVGLVVLASVWGSGDRVGAQAARAGSAGMDEPYR